MDDKELQNYLRSKKRVAFGEDARARMLAGIDSFARALRVTLGPKGRNVCKPGYYKAPWITNDGKSIWEDMEFLDGFQNMGIQLLKQAADKVSKAVGDGTTTTTVLAHQMVRDGHRLIAAGSNPMLLKQGMEIAVKVATEEIMALAKPMDSYDMLYKVILTAVKDEDVAKAMAEAAQKIGGTGLMNVWRSMAREKVRVEYTNGMKYRRGYASPYFILDNTTEGVTLQKPKILVVDGDIKGSYELIPLLTRLKEAGFDSLYVVAKDYQGDAISVLLRNSEEGVIKSVATRAPSYGEFQSEHLQDVAVFCGATPVGDTLTLPISYAGISDLGEADSVSVVAEWTTIVGGKGDPAAIKGRIERLRDRKERTKDSVERGRYDERIANLASTTAIVHIGGETEVDRNELLWRAESASGAMTLSEEEGILPGGGTAFLHASSALGALRDEYQGDVARGIDLVRWALPEPLRQIAENSGENGNTVVGMVRRLQKERDNEYLGYSALTGEYCDMIEAGVVEPAKLTRLVLQYAVSCAAMILTCEVCAAIANPKERH